MGDAARILVVSSDPRHRRILARALNSQGWGTLFAAGLAECQDALAENGVWLIFCEHELPDGTYGDVLAAIHAVKQDVRFVVTSRVADWDEYLKALHCGAFDLIASPCEPSEVTRVLNQAEGERLRSGFSAHKARSASAGFG